MQEIIGYIAILFIYLFFIVAGFNTYKFFANLIRFIGYLAFITRRNLKEFFIGEKVVIKDKSLLDFKDKYIQENQNNINLFAKSMLLDLVDRYNFHLKSLTIRNERFSEWNFWINISLVVSTPLLLLVLSVDDTIFDKYYISLNIFSLNIEINDSKKIKELLVTILGFTVSFVGALSKIIRADDKCKLASDKLIEMQDWKQSLIREMSTIKTNKKLIKFLSKKNDEISILGREILEGLFFRN